MVSFQSRAALLQTRDIHETYRAYSEHHSNVSWRRAWGLVLSRDSCASASWIIDSDCGNLYEWYHRYEVRGTHITHWSMCSQKKQSSKFVTYLTQISDESNACGCLRLLNDFTWNGVDTRLLGMLKTGAWTLRHGCEKKKRRSVAALS